VDADLEEHLLGCEGCRKALADAALSSVLLREAATPPITTNLDAFAARVMATIRGESRLTGFAGIWRPLELLASRFALAAAVLLLAISVYLAEFAPPFHMPTINSETSQTEVGAEVGAGMPEPPAQPSSQDEVLISLAERTNDF
jgi:predicted anti-sigma-YlaC factor YlaD